MQSVYTLWSMVDHLIKKVYWNNKCLHMKEYIDSICTQAYLHGDIEDNTCYLDTNGYNFNIFEF